MHISHHVNDNEIEYKTVSKPRPNSGVKAVVTPAAAAPPRICVPLSPKVEEEESAPSRSSKTSSLNNVNYLQMMKRKLAEI